MQANQGKFITSNQCAALRFSFFCVCCESGGARVTTLPEVILFMPVLVHRYMFFPSLKKHATGKIYGGKHML